MAEVVFEIGTGGGRDYSSIAAWADDIDAAYGSGDDAVGELYADGDLDTGGTTVVISQGTTAGVLSIQLRPATGEGHDGTPGSGARIRKTTGSFGQGAITLSSAKPTTIIGLEVDLNDTRWSGFSITTGHEIARCLIHDTQDTSGINNAIGFSGFGNNQIRNNVIYNILRSDADVNGIHLASNGDCDVTNNTLYNVDGTGCTTFSNNAWTEYSNNLVVDSTTADFANASSSTGSKNASSDSTAPNAIASEPVTAAVEFVSTVSGFEDLSLDSGAESVNAGDVLGADVLTATDANGRNRSAEGDTWDLGAYEYVTAVTGLEFSSTLVTTSAFELEPERNAEFASTLVTTSGFELAVPLDVEFASTLVTTSEMFIESGVDIAFESNLVTTSAFELEAERNVAFESNLVTTSAFEMETERNVAFESNLVTTSAFEMEIDVASATLTGGDATHQVTDGPLKNAAVLDYGNANAPSQIKDAGRLATGTSTYCNALSSRPMVDPTYFEATVVEGIWTQNQVGIINNTSPPAGTLLSENDTVVINVLGDVYEESVGPSPNYASFAVNDVINVAFEPSTGRVWFGKNGTWLGGTTPAVGGTGHDATLSSGTGYYVIAGQAFGGAGTGQMRYNFGPRPWAGTPPVGFNGLTG